MRPRTVFVCWAPARVETRASAMRRAAVGVKQLCRMGVSVWPEEQEGTAMGSSKSRVSYVAIILLSSFFAFRTQSLERERARPYLRDDCSCPGRFMPDARRTRLTILLFLLFAAAPPARPQATPTAAARWYRGNTHCHTLNSDGNAWLCCKRITC
jgi:hypothetical protein